jgi:hypothetical protein
MTLIMASTDRERTKIQISQNLVKMTSSQRVHHKNSNNANNLSNRVTDRKIFMVKFGQPSQVNIRTVDVNTNTDDVNIRTGYVACVGGDTCHGDINMVMW